MKTQILTILCFFPAIMFGQFKFINMDLVYPDTSLLYSSLENHLTISGQKNLQGFQITSSKKTRITVNVDHVIAEPTTNEEFETLTVSKGNKVIFAQGFKIIKLNNYIAQLAFTFDSVLSKNKILSNPFITAKFPNSLYKLKVGIKSFGCSIYRKNGEKLFYFTTGNKLSEQMITSIMKLSSKDEIVFDNIIGGIAPLFCPRIFPSFKVIIQ